MRDHHLRLNQIFEERDRDFPRRDPSNTREMEAALEAYAAAIRARRDAAWRPAPRLLAEAGGMAESAVFICGHMKSGTTLLAGLLDGHPELTVLPGDSHMMRLIDQQRRPVRRPGPGDQAAYWIAQFANPLGQKPFWFLGDDDGSYVEFAQYLDHWLAALPPADRSPFLAMVLALYCANPLRARRPNAWVEKTPGNELRAQEILRLYPAARFVHIVRDPMSNLASIKQLCLHRGWSWNAAANAWRVRRSIRAGVANQKNLGRARYHLLRYEDLVSDPEREMRELASVVGISWEDSLVTPTVNGVLLGSNSMYADRRVRGEVLNAPSDRRYEELTRGERLAIAAILRRTARRRGYRWEPSVRRRVRAPGSG